jgi:hypothetical protein
MHERINRWEGEGGALAPRTLQHPMPVYVAARNSNDAPLNACRPSPRALQALRPEAKRRPTNVALPRVSSALAAPRTERESHVTDDHYWI